MRKLQVIKLNLADGGEEGSGEVEVAYDSVDFQEGVTSNYLQKIQIRRCVLDLNGSSECPRIYSKNVLLNVTGSFFNQDENTQHQPLIKYSWFLQTALSCFIYFRGKAAVV